MYKKMMVVAALLAGVFLFTLSGCGDEKIVYTEYSPGEAFVTNPKDSTRFIKVSVVLVLDTDKLTDTLEENKGMIRSTIVSIFRNEEEETLRQVDLSPIRKKIMAELNEKLEIDNIIDILFSDYVIQ